MAAINNQKLSFLTILCLFIALNSNLFFSQSVAAHHLFLPGPTSGSNIPAAKKNPSEDYDGNSSTPTPLSPLPLSPPALPPSLPPPPPPSPPAPAPPSHNDKSKSGVTGSLPRRSGSHAGSSTPSTPTGT